MEPHKNVETSTNLATFSNGWYKPGRSLPVRFIWYFINSWLFKSYILPVSAPKVWLLRLFGARVGKGVVIKPGVNIKHPWRLSIGHYSWIGEGVWIDNLADVRIGNHCCISQGAMLLTGNHNYKKASFDLIIGKIVLEDGAWAGAQTVVCPGVTLGKESVLTVGSMATTSTKPYGIYQGNPALWIKERIIQPTA